MKAAQIAEDSSVADGLAEEAKRYTDAIIRNLDSRCNYGWANILHSAVSRATLIATAERRRGSPIMDSIRRKFILTQDELMEKAYPRVTIISLYRRYNTLYLLGLEDAVLTLLDCKDLEEAHSRLTERIKNVGGAQKTDIKKLHASAKLKANITVGEE